MRIYKGSEITLKLYTRINCQSIETDKMRVVLFTTNPNNSYMVNNVVVSGDTLLVTVGRNDLNAMEDGVINYIILGYDDNEEIYNSTRQSNYYLKTPDGYVAKSIQTSKDVYIVDNGDYKILPDEDYSSIEEVNVHVEFDAEPYIQRGIELGEENQKSKLESVSITENGTYTREDGYNEIHVEVPDLNGDYQTGYDEGYEAGIDYASENAGEIAAQTARVLDITENGTYLSRYSDPYIPTDITGYFDDGTPFYGSAELVNTLFYTDIIGTADSYFEVWWKDLQNYTLDYSAIVGLEQNGCIFKVCKRDLGGDSFVAQYGASPVNSKEYGFKYNMSDWTHIKFSREGLYINGEKMDFDFQFDFTNPNSAKFQINDVENGRYANGVFGMVKIDGRTFIPTEEGFKNYSTGEMLEFYKEERGSYKYIINDPIYGEGNLIKTVNVNVTPKINPNNYNLKFGYSSFTSLPEWVEWEKITDYENLFFNCQQLKDISLLKKINGKSLYSTFKGCNSIKGDNIKHLDISNVTNMNNTFNQTGLDYFPSLDTSNVTDFNYCFGSCNQLKYVEPIDTSKATNFSQMFYAFSEVKALERLPEFDCTNVTSITQYFCYDNYKDKMDNLTDVGGWKNLKIDWTSYGLNVCRNLSYQSCINVLNGLYDFRGNGDETTTRTLKVHQNFLDTVGDEISIGVAKGWVISA